MRQVVLDTETTGTDWRNGDRVVEIGAVELIARRPSGRTFQRYLNPDRDSHPEALKIHGLTSEFLADKPRFHEVAEDFLAFIDGAELLIHNAAFDVGFLDRELSRLDGPAVTLAERCRIEDTLLMARQRFPGQRNTLDALCKRLDVDNSGRELHGALLDAQLLAEVYLALTSGQSEIGFGEAAPVATAALVRMTHIAGVAAARPRIAVSAEELAAHEARLDQIERKGHCLWRALAPG